MADLRPGSWLFSASQDFVSKVTPWSIMAAGVAGAGRWGPRGKELTLSTCKSLFRSAFQHLLGQILVTWPHLTLSEQKKGSVAKEKGRGIVGAAARVSGTNLLYFSLCSRSDRKVFPWPLFEIISVYSSWILKSPLNNLRIP